MKKVSLGSELAEVRCTAEGVRVLSDLLANDGAPDEATARALPRRISAALNLIIERLRLVERAVNGSVNPAAVHAEHNAHVGGEGLAVAAWGDRRLRQELVREQRRLDFDRRRERRRRRS